MNLYESIASELKSNYEKAWKDYNTYIHDAQKLLDGLKDIAINFKDKDTGYRLLVASSATEGFEFAGRNIIDENHPNLILMVDNIAGHDIECQTVKGKPTRPLTDKEWNAIISKVKSLASKLGMKININGPKIINEGLWSVDLGLEIEIVSYTGKA